jgi:YfiH family protein
VDVASNRVLLQQAMGAHPVFLSQVHGAQVVVLSGHTADGAQGDGCITDMTGVACAVMVADCLPVLLTNLQGRLVAAAHAGWRGLAGQGGQGILEAVLARCLAGVNGSQGAAETLAWLGPCIGPQSFEVGEEVREIFVASDPVAVTMFRPKSGGKWLADLPGLARLRLNALGVTRIYGNDGSLAWCTVSNPSRFFSHRRDGVSGRMAACIWLD